jgi:protein involved in polysaccharide export with SLBB domain
MSAAMNKNSFRQRITCLLIVASSSGCLLAADPEPATGSTPAPDTTNNLTMSVSSPMRRAAWQQHLTLGPGDVLNLSLLDMPDTSRMEVPVGPDGRISFLQGANIMAAGLTIDELRSKIDESLGKFYQNPHTIITPVAFRSKKYVVMGAVMNKGVYAFDRPTSVIEAIARAGGLETGLYENKSVELADLRRSFLARNGQRIPVDFEKLFQRGDLSQNVPLEPGDYLYFASASGNEIYVLGEVMLPGPMIYNSNPTVLNAIATRGGYTTRAFKSRVLVIRGSINHPQTFVVDTADILHGKAKDFPLEPHDIVYVSMNPWVIAGEVLDVAAKSFVQAVVVQGTIVKMPPANW